MFFKTLYNHYYTILTTRTHVPRFRYCENTKITTDRSWCEYVSRCYVMDVLMSLLIQSFSRNLLQNLDRPLPQTTSIPPYKTNFISVLKVRKQAYIMSVCGIGSIS